MLNITIQNDGKIKFQSECSSTKDMRHNVNFMKNTLESTGCICRITNGF